MSEHVEVVIKIPKYYLTHPQDYSCLAECVRRGILLPKGHGRLIDADVLCDYFWDNRSKLYSHKDLQIVIDRISTIIEADKEGEINGL